MYTAQKEFNPFVNQKLLTGSLTNSEDPDEMLHNTAFHQGLHCLLRLERNSIVLEITITFHPSICTMDRPAYIVSDFMENSIGHKRVKESNIYL